MFIYTCNVCAPLYIKIFDNLQKTKNKKHPAFYSTVLDCKAKTRSMSGGATYSYVGNQYSQTSLSDHQQCPPLSRSGHPHTGRGLVTTGQQ